MPIYDFVCSMCGERQEVIQSFSADAPECCGQPMKRGFGNLVLWFWKDLPYVAPIVHDSQALSRHYSHEWAQLHSKEEL